MAGIVEFTKLEVEAAQKMFRKSLSPYDWKFCPWFLHNCIKVSAGYLSVLSDEEIQQMMAAE